MGETIFSRLFRAFLYSMVVLIVILSGSTLNNANISDLSINTNLYHILYSLLITFLISITYVNVYILFPNPHLNESEVFRHFRKTAAAYTISLLVLIFFLIPTILYTIWVFNSPQVEHFKWRFIIYFLVTPGILYIITLFLKSGLFYSKPVIDLRLFDFRHQLITPGMLLISVPFCIGYIIYNDVEWNNIFYVQGFIQILYFFFCYSKRPASLHIKFKNKVYLLNFFFLLNILLFTFFNVYSFFNHQVRFILLGVWFGLYMMSFEFWTSIYFKEAENSIRKLFNKEIIDLSQKYITYYIASASSFTILIVLFPLTFLLNKYLSNIYLWVIIYSSIYIWSQWLLNADNISDYYNNLIKIRKLKFFAIAPAISIILEAFIKINFPYNTSQNAVLIASQFFIPTIYLTILVFPSRPELKVKLRNTFYWYCGFAMCLICILLFVFFDDSPLRIITLQYNYVYAAIFIIVLLAISEREILFERFPRN